MNYIVDFQQFDVFIKNLFLPEYLEILTENFKN